MQSLSLHALADSRFSADTATPVDIHVYVRQAVFYSLCELRVRATPGSSCGAIDRSVARILNSFEEHRVNIKAFKGTQEVKTMTGYAALWSGLISFLLRLLEDNASCPLLHIRYVELRANLRALLTTVRSTGETLHAVNPKQLPLKECLTASAFDSESESDSETGSVFSSAAPRKPLSLHASEFVRAVEDISIVLVRFHWDQSAFASPVVGYVALQTLNARGAWIPAKSFSFPLSDWIHCMQLWLLSYCLRQKNSWQSGDIPMKSIVKEQCQLYLINTNPCPIAELSFWRLLAWTASNDTVRHPITSMNEDCTQITHATITLDVEKWRMSIPMMLDSAGRLLEDTLLLGLHEAPHYSVGHLVDDFSDNTPGKSFLDDPRNNLHAVKDWLWQRLQTSDSLRARFFETATIETSEVAASTRRSFRVRQSKVDGYLLAVQRFLRLLAVLLLWTSGLPPRRKELMGIAWCNQETARNVYISNGLVVFVTGYHKTAWRIGHRPIARFVAPAVGELLVRYLIYVPVFTRFLHRCMQNQNPSLASNSVFLFNDGDQVWSPDRWSNFLKRQSTLELGFALNSRHYRHIAILLDKRLMRGVACKQYGVAQDFLTKRVHAVDDSDSERDDDYDGLMDGNVRVSHDGRFSALQAAHTVAVHDSHYGNDIDVRHGMTDSVLATFRQVSLQWQRDVVQLADQHKPDTASNHKRGSSRQSIDPSPLTKRSRLGSRLQVRREMWTWSAIELTLKRLFGPHAEPRSLEQRNGLILVARSRPELIIVMPTGSGKSLLFVVPSQLPQTQTTIVIVPLLALKQDLVDRCKEWRVACTTYDRIASPHRLHALPALLLVDIEDAVHDTFLAFVSSLHTAGRLDRLVLDEAHFLVTARLYRKHLPAIHQLRRINCPFVCMTATLPALAELELRQTLHLTQPQVLRARSDRPNLRYCVQPLTSKESKASNSSTLLLTEAVQITLRETAAWSAAASRTGTAVTARGICYVRSKALGQKLADRLHATLYHGTLGQEDRKASIDAWIEGRSSFFIVATSSFSAGFHYPFVRMVLHVDAPDGLLNYGQETGRAGRDGLPAVCMTLLADNWAVNWDDAFTTDFLRDDSQQMTRFLRSRSCLRQRLTSYLDGDAGVACNPLALTPSPRPECSVCSPISNPSLKSLVVPSSHPSPRSRVIDAPLLSSPINILALQRPSPLDDETSADEDSEASDETSLHAGSILSASASIASSEDRSIYDVAASLAREVGKDREEGFDLYEERIVTWGRTCIPCSYQTKSMIEGSHQDCVQDEHRQSLNTLRRNVGLRRFSGCFNCGHMQAICPNRGKKGGCVQPWLAWHVAWSAYYQDPDMGHQMIVLLGGPTIDKKSDGAVLWNYCHWLGQESSLFDRPISNMGRLLYYWVDRLESRCGNS